MVLPAGVEVPPLPHLLAVLVGVAVVAYGLRAARVRVTPRTIVAFAPWMAVGSTLYVTYQLDVLPEPVAPFASSPIVYASTFVLAGLCWIGASRTDAPLRVLAGTGFLALAAPVGVALQYGSTHGGLALAWPAVGVAAGVVAAAVVWAVLRRVRPAAARVTWPAGALVVLGHALDGTTTAVGVDVLGFGERTPLSRIILEFAAGLPTADALGSGWLFVLVKLALAAGITVLLADYVRDDEAGGSLLLGLVAAVGLGPGMHNALLFVVTAP
ncbi:DUF63 family protein [Salarchaeum sp. JOR-1]|uniref:DUF63 family protein n=1 Tax=Salarchaeum sp. JOR-1 TaxID=2599399 RepID=UPI0011984D22|nr:DUF63 family protein [Salarchaeum sp. JOR-1]QDX40717.1 DUF63 family protein [Salarchaeum sp. JOR-1]